VENGKTAAFRVEKLHEKTSIFAWIFVHFCVDFCAFLRGNWCFLPKIKGFCERV